MKISSEHFRVEPGKQVDLSEWPTIVKPFCKSKKHYKLKLHEASNMNSRNPGWQLPNIVSDG